MKTLKQSQKIFVLYVLIAFCSISLFSACEKDDAAPSFAVPTPDFAKPSDADAVLVALHSSVPSPIKMPTVPGMPAESTDIMMDFGLGVALFKDNGRADKVLLNNTALSFTNGVYTWMPNLTNMTDPSSVSGIDLSGNISWNITNPNIQKTLTSMPGKPVITSSNKIDKSQGYTLTNKFAAGSQKVLYVIYTEKKHVLKEMGAGSVQCKFTAAELAALGSSKNGMIQANAYTISDEMIGGKKIYFIKQSSYTLTNVEIN